MRDYTVNYGDAGLVQGELSCSKSWKTGKGAVAYHANCPYENVGWCVIFSYYNRNELSYHPNDGDEGAALEQAGDLEGCAKSSIVRGHFVQETKEESMLIISMNGASLEICNGIRVERQIGFGVRPRRESVDPLPNSKECDAMRLIYAGMGEIYSKESVRKDKIQDKIKKSLNEVMMVKGRPNFTLQNHTLYTLQPRRHQNRPHHKQSLKERI